MHFSTLLKINLHIKLHLHVLLYETLVIETNFESVSKLTQSSKSILDVEIVLLHENHYIISFSPSQVDPLTHL